MITYLRVRNLAIVEEIAIEPGPGLNVLTGETGAGKSLLIDSLGFLSGARGSTSMIRTGEEKMTAEAVFHLPKRLGRALEALGVEAEAAGDGIELIVRREIAEGRSRVFLGGTALSVRELSGVMDTLLEIHGQHESLERIAGQTFRELLDDWCGHEEELETARRLYDAWRAAADRLEELTRAQRDRELRIDLLAYQIDEITAASLSDGEEETLREERAILGNAQEMAEATAAAFTLLDDSEESALVLIGRASQHLHGLARVITEIGTIHEELEDARIRLQEVARSLGRAAEGVRSDPARLEEVEDRLALIERFKKKYGATIADILSYVETIRTEHETLTDFESSMDRLRSAEQKSFDLWRDVAGALSDGRRNGATRLRKAIEQELKDLAMEGTRVEVRVGSAAASDSRLEIDGRPVSFGAEGWDRVEVWIAANRGEDLRPIQKSASGGELSRIQLAMAAALFKHSKRAAAATLVFDEIDAGIGGRVADAVGAKLRELARSNQVVCVTHLPQIASFASTHFRVWKEDVAGRTRARISRLDARDERVAEIARMLGGSESSGAARTHAAEMLERSVEAGAQPARKRTSSRAVS